MTSRIRTLTLIILQLIALTFSVTAAGDVDPTFNPGLIQMNFMSSSAIKTSVCRGGRSTGWKSASCRAFWGGP
jgi:hypothetical protein